MMMFVWKGRLILHAWMMNTHNHQTHTHSHTCKKTQRHFCPMLHQSGLCCACVCVCARLSKSRMMDKAASLSCFCQIGVQQQSLTRVCVSFFLCRSAFLGNAGRQAKLLPVLSLTSLPHSPPSVFINLCFILHVNDAGWLICNTLSDTPQHTFTGLHCRFLIFFRVPHLHNKSILV